MHAKLLAKVAQLHWQFSASQSFDLGTGYIYKTNPLILSPFENPNNHKTYYIGLLNTVDMDLTAQMGAVGILSVVIVEKDNSGIPWLKAVIRIPRVVVDITTQADGTKKCKTAKVSNPDIQQDVMIATNDTSAITEYTWFQADLIGASLMCH